jgi:hypothetical protein
VTLAARALGEETAKIDRKTIADMANEWIGFWILSNKDDMATTPPNFHFSGSNSKEGATRITALIFSAYGILHQVLIM